MRRIMYIENKEDDLDGDGRIGWVETTRTGRSFLYRGRRLGKTKSGYKYNCIDEDNGDRYWISGPRVDGADKLYGGIVQIDDDARVDYWTKIRGRPDLTHQSEYRAGASTRTQGRSRGDDLSIRARSRA
jgi:hypothetical protein